MRHLTIVTLLTALWLCGSAQASNLDSLLDAIMLVESGGDNYAVGDHGKSRGPFQIRRAYWEDACEYGGVKWPYHKYVYNREKSRQVVIWHWKRYAKRAFKNMDYKVLASVHHNGAGNGNRVDWPYWRKVRERLKH